MFLVYFTLESPIKLHSAWYCFLVHISKRCVYYTAIEWACVQESTTGEWPVCVYVCVSESPWSAHMHTLNQNAFTACYFFGLHRRSPIYAEGYYMQPAIILLLIHAARPTPSQYAWCNKKKRAKEPRNQYNFTRMQTFRVNMIKCVRRTDSPSWPLDVIYCMRHCWNVNWIRISNNPNAKG